MVFSTSHIILPLFYRHRLANTSSAVRQAIICSGDITLEEFKAVSDDNGKVISYFIDGMGTTHQCRDWESIKAFLVKNRFVGAEEAEHHHGP